MVEFVEGACDGEGEGVWEVEGEEEDDDYGYGYAAGDGGHGGGRAAGDREGMWLCDGSAAGVCFYYQRNYDCEC